MQLLRAHLVQELLRPEQVLDEADRAPRRKYGKYGTTVKCLNGFQSSWSTIESATTVQRIRGSWRRMTEMMGVHNQGGPAVGFLPELPKATVPRGYVMRHDKDGNHVGEHKHH